MRVMRSRYKGTSRVKEVIRYIYSQASHSLRESGTSSVSNSDRTLDRTIETLARTALVVNPLASPNPFQR